MKYSNHHSILKINQVIKKGNFSFTKLDLVAIEKELNDPDTSKVSKYSSIPPNIVKDNSSICAKPLVSIINKGILNGKFDDGLKLADLIPFHKGDETTNKNNYRNISLLPVISKNFEEIVHKQIGTNIGTYPVSTFTWISKRL